MMANSTAHERVAPEYVRRLGLRHVAWALDKLSPWRPKPFTWGEYRREQARRRRGAVR